MTPPHSPVVDVKQAFKSYRTGESEVPGLIDVTLSVHAGEYLSVMGASGSGKSTMLNVLGTLDRLDRGSYLLDGRSVDALDDQTLSHLRACKLGFVFQSFHLLERYSAVENVELALLYARTPRKARRERALQALERVGLGDRAHHLPSQLSGGQQQRVSLARALVNEPSLLLADEPTGALDSVTTEEILDMFDQLHHEGATLIVVTHDRDVAERAERNVIMRDGRIVRDRVRPRLRTSDRVPASEAAADSVNARVA